MARRVRHGGSPRNDRDPDGSENWDLGEGLDPEGPSAEDLDMFGDELRTCPHCSSAIYDQADVCPRCGFMLDDGERTLSLWAVLVVCVCIVVMLFYVF